MPDISVTNMLLLCISFVGLGIALIAIQSNRKLSLKLSKALELINSLHRLHEVHQNKIEAIEKKQHNIQQDLQQDLQQHIAKQLAELKSTIFASQQTDMEAIKQIIDKIEAEVEDMSQQDPAAKMYAKAHSLVESGASIDEIIEACDLPKAEVEILIGFQKKARK
ncbi:MAG: DNA anti-recombination protein RmuC [Glaciecola sp.]|jgi:DNA anti-recombination protein RmuC